MTLEEIAAKVDKHLANAIAALEEGVQATKDLVPKAAEVMRNMQAEIEAIRKQ